ncbi:hypothetical protein AM305_11985 [Actinobacillus minor NM305]|uniref:Uncharacterized protein n=1 Tax=Actinobacillus minor NM305 TaxID=637911 RepID=C5S3E3_9PAST|nr:hypothetical protein AM305_11985 [Actinobacillus minor NM305]
MKDKNPFSSGRFLQNFAEIRPLEHYFIWQKSLKYTPFHFKKGDFQA